MLTQSEIQKCKKILFDEVGQNDELGQEFAVSTKAMNIPCLSSPFDVASGRALKITI